MTAKPQVNVAEMYVELLRLRERFAREQRMQAERRLHCEKTASRSNQRQRHDDDQCDSDW